MPIDIKRIYIDEIDSVIELFDKYRIFYKQPSDIGLAESFLRERLSNNESVIFLAISNEGDKAVPAGFTQLYPKYSSIRTIKNWILNDLYVAPAFRKQGIGEKLIKQTMDFAKTGGSRFVELSTATDNFTAQSLYEGIGFIKQQPDAEFITYRIEI